MLTALSCQYSVINYLNSEDDNNQSEKSDSEPEQDEEEKSNVPENIDTQDKEKEPVAGKKISKEKMTRFARSKGSKASNERVEEEATPWEQLTFNLAPIAAKKRDFDVEDLDDDGIDYEQGNLLKCIVNKIVSS